MRTVLLLTVGVGLPMQIPTCFGGDGECVREKKDVGTGHCEGDIEMRLLI